MPLRPGNGRGDDLPDGGQGYAVEPVGLADLQARVLDNVVETVLAADADSALLAPDQG